MTPYPVVDAATVIGLLVFWYWLARGRLKRGKRRREFEDAVRRVDEQRWRRGDGDGKRSGPVHPGDTT